MNYPQARAELFSMINTASIAALSSLLTNTIQWRWPGVANLADKAPVDGFWARPQYTTLRDNQTVVSRVDDVSRYEALGQLLIEVYSPISLAGSLESGNIFAEALRSAFRGQSQSGELFFTNQLVRESGNNDTHYITNVFVTVTYANVQ